jgi:hypothetical protein
MTDAKCGTCGVTLSKEDTVPCRDDVPCPIRVAAEFARSAIDEHLGDTDLNGDDSPLFLACQKLSVALDGSQ